MLIKEEQNKNEKVLNISTTKPVENYYIDNNRNNNINKEIQHKDIIYQPNHKQPNIIYTLKNKYYSKCDFRIKNIKNFKDENLKPSITRVFILSSVFSSFILYAGYRINNFNVLFISLSGLFYVYGKLEERYCEPLIRKSFDDKFTGMSIGEIESYIKEH